MRVSASFLRLILTSHYHLISSLLQYFSTSHRQGVDGNLFHRPGLGMGKLLIYTLALNSLLRMCGAGKVSTAIPAPFNFCLFLLQHSYLKDETGDFTLEGIVFEEKAPQSRHFCSLPGFAFSFFLSTFLIHPSCTGFVLS